MNSQDIRDALEDTDIFNLEASEDSDKQTSYNPQVSGNNQSDTVSNSEYGISG